MIRLNLFNKLNKLNKNANTNTNRKYYQISENKIKKFIMHSNENYFDVATKTIIRSKHDYPRFNDLKQIDNEARKHKLYTNQDKNIFTTNIKFNICLKIASDKLNTITLSIFNIELFMQSIKGSTLSDKIKLLTSYLDFIMLKKKICIDDINKYIYTFGIEIIYNKSDKYIEWFGIKIIKKNINQSLDSSFIGGCR